MARIVPTDSAMSAALTRLRCKVLVVHHQAEIRDYVLEVLAAGGYQGRAVDDPSAALCDIAQQRPSLVLLADRLASGSDAALGLVERLAQGTPPIPVIVMSLSWTGDLARRAMARGAFDVIEQPWDPAHILRVVEHAIAGSRWRQDRGHAAAPTGDELIGASKATMRLRKMIEGAASVERPVLLIGASGSGKELAARQIHRQSPRANQPFVAANCAAMDAGRIDRMLFGAAAADEPEGDGALLGAIERARGGIVYIGGIDALPENCQRKLLLLLLEGALELPEGQIRINVDARLIVATAVDLQIEVAAGRFRADLYHQLKSICIRVPSLAERRDDIPILVRYFMQRFAARKGLPACDIDAAALAALQAADWPGQGRELRNIVERLMILSGIRKAPIAARSLPADVLARGAAGAGSFAETMDLSFEQARSHFERFFLAAQLARFGGNISRTAQFLRMGRSTLHRRLKNR